MSGGVAVAVTDRRRDVEGRHWTAPAWSGDLGLLDAYELSRRVDAVGAHIGRVTAKMSPFEDRFAVSVDVSEITRWARVRVACLNELERRAEEAGVSRLDLVFAAPSWGTDT